MIKKIIGLVLSIFLVSCSNVSFDNIVSKEVSTINFINNETNDEFTRILLTKLEQSGVNIAKNNKQYPTLNLNKVSNSSVVISLFDTGVKAEEDLYFTVDASIKFVDNTIATIYVKLDRNIFDNPKAALAKDIEKKKLIEDMYERAADDLFVKIMEVIKTKNEKNNH